MTTREKIEYYLLSIPISVLKPLTLIWDGLYPHTCCLSGQNTDPKHFQAPEPWGKSSHIHQKKKSTLTAYNISSKLNKYDNGPG